MSVLFTEARRAYRLLFGYAGKYVSHHIVVIAVRGLTVSALS